MKQCEYCKSEIPNKKICKGKTRFCSRECLYKWMRANATQFGKKNRKTLQCLYCKKKFSVISTSSRKFCCLKCVHESNKGRKLTQKHKDIISLTRRKDWVKGVYSNAVVGKTKWIEHIKPDGTIVKCQGTWEQSYAIYLDKQKIAYDCHVGALWYDAVDGKKRVYLPDFFLRDEKIYIDIKNDYLLKIDSDKLRRVQKCNPKIKIQVITKKMLMELNLIDERGRMIT